MCLTLNASKALGEDCDNTETGRTSSEPFIPAKDLVVFILIEAKRAKCC